MSNKNKRKRTPEASTSRQDATATELPPNFKKVFRYPEPENESWSLPTPANFCEEEWEDTSLQALKSELNEVKSSLSDIDIGKWHSHTRRTQLGGAIQRHVQKHVQAEFCTQAWCKFFEILAQFSIVPPTRYGNYKSVHLCEVPGAFVTSLNHFLKSRGYYKSWEWLAFSSNPYYEGNEPGSTIFDDTVIRDTRPHWFFGEDNSGDITNVENVMSLVDRTGKWTANLVTADGSVNCADKPAEQEDVVASLLLAEVVSALYITAPGGSFVLKMFTMFEASSVSLLYLLNYHFADVYVTKPIASKPGNSEVYVVCKSFLGIEQNLMNKLIDLVAKKEPLILPRNMIPESFFQSHKDCSAYFTQLQTQTIQLNLDLFRRESRDWLEGVTSLRQVCAKKFVEENRLQPISKTQRMLQPWSNSNREAEETQFYFSVLGSYNERVEEASRTWQEKMSAATPFNLDSTENDVTWLELNDIVKPITGYSYLRLTVGTRSDKIVSSRFCHQTLLNSYNTMLTGAQYKNLVPVATLGQIFQNLEQILTENFFCLPTSEKSSESDFVQYGLNKYPCSANFDQVCTYLSDTTTTVSVLSQDQNYEQKVVLDFYDAVVELLKKVKLGDNFVCRIVTCLSRLSISVVYLLKMVFHRVTVSALTDDLYCYVICCGFEGTDNCLLGRLRRARSHGSNLLQIIPLDWMEYPGFRNKMIAMNHQIISKKVNAMIDAEKRGHGLK